MKWWILFIGLMGVAIWDWYKKEIYLPVPASLAVVGLFYAMGKGALGMKAALLGILPGVVLLGISFVTGGEVGEGDGWLLAAMGIYMGPKLVFVLFLLSAFLIMPVGVGLLLCKKGKRKTRLPWAPFAWCAYVILWSGGILI